MPVVVVTLNCFGPNNDAFSLEVKLERFESFSPDSFVDANFVRNGQIVSAGREAIDEWTKFTGCEVKFS